MLKTTPILRVKITLNSRLELLNYIRAYLMAKHAQPLTIVTPNPEQVIEAQKNVRFRDILNSADVALPDGMRLIWAMKLLSKKLLPTTNYPLQTLKRISGIDFMEDLLRLAAKNGYMVALIGGREGVAGKAFHHLQKKYPGLQGWAEDAEEFRIKNDEIIIMEKNNQNKTLDSQSSILNSNSNPKEEYFSQLAKRIKETDVKLVFVGLGAPKQEYFIETLSKQWAVSSVQNKTTVNGKPQTANSLVLMSVGGAFDIFSGKIPRAPRLFKNHEFIWRLLMQPWRFRRHLSLIKFIFLVFKSRFW